MGLVVNPVTGKLDVSGQSSSTPAPVTSVAGKTGDVTLNKTDVGLSNVDNTSDANKQISTAVQTALDGKVASSRAVATQHSLAGGGNLSADRTLSLVGDTATPGANKVYGTDGTGARGWKSDPSGGVISTPQVIYVDQSGNDGTAEVGNPAKPFLSGQAAFFAGEVLGVDYVLVGGLGVFYIDITGGYTGRCRALHGRGFGADWGTSPTVWSISGVPADALNSYGASAIGIAVGIYHCAVGVAVKGGSVTGSDGSTYVAGNGGAVTLWGLGAVAVDARGGGDTGSSSSGQVNGGNGGQVQLFGSLRLVDIGIDARGGVSYAGMPGYDGTVLADSCDLRGSILSSSIELARCSVVSGLSYTDKGGNATW